MNKIEKLKFNGEIVSVKARIRLIRSFDEVSHQYQGYTLIIKGIIDGENKTFKVAIGPKAHEKHQFRISDEIEGKCHPVPGYNNAWAEFYKVSGLKLLGRDDLSDTTPSRWWYCAIFRNIQRKWSCKATKKDMGRKMLQMSIWIKYAYRNYN